MKLERQKLFEKYGINKSHNVWDNKIDNWMSVEIYRIMHNGNLPPSDDISVNWITDFLNKCNYDDKFMGILMQRDDWGNLYLTAKRLIYKLSNQILKQ